MGVTATRDSGMMGALMGALMGAMGAMSGAMGTMGAMMGVMGVMGVESLSTGLLRWWHFHFPPENRKTVKLFNFGKE